MSSSRGKTGIVGQKKFSQLCSEADVVCNKSEEDERGWDFFIEYPEVRQPNTPLDRRKPARPALVQVKTTKTTRAAVTVSLSNALRMAESSQPFFIVFIRLASGPRREAIYVRHIWRDELAHILRAVRQADCERDEALHRRFLSFTFSESEATADPLAAIAMKIDDVGTGYTEAKRQLVNTLGFEDGYGKADVTLEIKSPEDIMDLQLGLRDSLPFTRFAYKSRRFGIDSGQPEILSSRGSLSVRPSPRNGTLRLCSSSGEEFFTPAQAMGVVMPGGDPLMRKGRIIAGCIELILHGSGKTQVVANLKTDDQVPLATIELFGQLMQWRGTGPISLTFHAENRVVQLGSIDLDNDLGLDLGWIEIGKAASILKKVAKTAMVETVNLSPLDLNSAREEIELMTHLVGPGRY